MKFRTIDDERSMRRPDVGESLAPLTGGPERDFEYRDRLLEGIDWSDASSGGTLESSAVEDADLSGASLAPLEVVDVVVEHSVLSNARWERATARRLEIIGSQLVGWQAQFDLAADVYVADCRADFAAVSIGAAKGPVVFERCRFSDASFLGDLSTSVFIDCAFRGADFTRVANARGCDLRRSDLGGLDGLMSLRGALITADQAVQIAGELALAAGFAIA